jgi:hypothetical protein
MIDVAADERFEPRGVRGIGLEPLPKQQDAGVAHQVRRCVELAGAVRDDPGLPAQGLVPCRIVEHRSDVQRKTDLRMLLITDPRGDEPPGPIARRIGGRIGSVHEGARA